MPTFAWATVAFAAGYAVGCLPVAWLLVRRRHGVDLRQAGHSGAIGALRVGGVGTALWSIGLEAVKGGFVGVFAHLAGAPGWIAALAIAGCVAGDAFPLSRRRGGRGVVPLVSGLLIALPLAGLITGAVAVLAIAFSRQGGATAARVVALAVPVGLVVGTDSWLALIPAGLVVLTLVARARLRSPGAVVVHRRGRLIDVSPPL